MAYSTKEGCYQKGFGVEYKKVVTTRHDRANVSPKDMYPGYEKSVKSSFDAACKDSKKG